MQLNSQLVKVGGPNKTATFDLIKDGKVVGQEIKTFDMLYVCPPQTAHDFMQGQPICDIVGWVNVDQKTLQNPDFPNIFGLGDGANTPNAKTAAAVRKQAPVVAQNLLSMLPKQPLTATMMATAPAHSLYRAAVLYWQSLAMVASYYPPFQSGS